MPELWKGAKGVTHTGFDIWIDPDTGEMSLGSDCCGCTGTFAPPEILDLYHKLGDYLIAYSKEGGDA